MIICNFLNSVRLAGPALAGIWGKLATGGCEDVAGREIHNSGDINSFRKCHIWSCIVVCTPPLPDKDYSDIQNVACRLIPCRVIAAWG